MSGNNRNIFDGSNVYRSGMDGYRKGASMDNGCLAALTYIIVFTVLSVVKGIFLWLWHKSKIAALIFLLLLLYLILWLFSGSKTPPFIFYPKTIAPPAFNISEFVAPVTNFFNPPKNDVVIQVNQNKNRAVPWKPCSNAVDSMILPGEIVQVTGRDPVVNLYKQPGSGFEVVGEVNPGDRVRTLNEGAYCSEGKVWWKVADDASGVSGWAAEGDSQGYWLESVQ